MHSTDIVAYTYRADLYTPQAMVAALTTNPALVGRPVVVARENVEINLDVLARLAGVDRSDESSYDSDVFPKVVFADQLSDDDTLVDVGGGYILARDL